MSDVSHTPGPWTAEYFGGDTRASVHAANGHCVCVCYTEDAPVIAAAPEMLAMLRRLEWSGHDAHGLEALFECPVCFGRQPTHSADCLLAALLAKADGK